MWPARPLNVSKSAETYINMTIIIRLGEWLIFICPTAKYYNFQVFSHLIEPRFFQK